VLETAVRPEGFAIRGLGASLAEEAGQHTLTLHSPAWDPAQLQALVKWFDTICDSFGCGELRFPANWPKCDRAILHRLGEQAGLPTRSSGVGAARRVALLSPGAADAADAAAAAQGVVAAPADEKAVDELLAVARSAKLRLSRGEAVEVLSGAALPPALAAALAALDAAKPLHAAAAAGDAAALAALLEGLLPAQVAQMAAVQMGHGDTALHGAARADSAECVALLLKAGANPDAVDGRGGTALAAARRAEACAAEAALLQNGAKDTTSSKRVFAAPLPRLSGAPEVVAEVPHALAVEAYTAAHVAAAAAAGLVAGVGLVAAWGRLMRRR